MIMPMTLQTQMNLFKLDPNTGILDWCSGVINVRDMLEMKAGKKLFNVDQNLVFSIIIPERTLDLQAAGEAERDYWVQGLRDCFGRLSTRGSIVGPSALNLNAPAVP